MVALRSPRGRPAEPAATPAVEPMAAPVEPVVVPSDAAPMLETLQAARDSIEFPPGQAAPDVNTLQAQIAAQKQAEVVQQEQARQYQEQLAANMKIEQAPKQEPAQLSERDLQFLGSRPGVEKDPAFGQAVGALAHVFQYGTDAFYDALEMKFPRSNYRREEPRQEPEPPAIAERKMEDEPKPRRIVTSAPVSRSGGGSDYTEPQGRVTLTAAEREIAAGAGMTDKQYAEQKIRLMKAKQSGLYNEGGG